MRYLPLDLTSQNGGGLPTNLMVNAPPNHNSCLKDSSLQKINNGDNRRLSISFTKSIKNREEKRRGGGGVNPNLSTLTPHCVLSLRLNRNVKPSARCLSHNIA